MSRWRRAATCLMLAAGLGIAQNSGSSGSQGGSEASSQPDSGGGTGEPFGLPPPFQPKGETPKKSDSAERVPKSEMPPEEDKSNAPTEVFSFNPVESKRAMDTGDYYFKKGNYIAAASRYDEATKWNDGNADAWLRLGEAQEKKPDVAAARAAYKKYLELAPDGKEASTVKKRLAKLKG